MSVKLKCFHLYTTILNIAITFCPFVNVANANPLSSLRPPFGDGEPYPPLIVISFDGFRWDYLTRTQTPNFNTFLQNGVTARYGLRNAFVTKTFPNHFTLATGLWEESHGIIANDMYDPVLNQSFTPRNISAMEDPAWFDTGAEPIWVTNQLKTPHGKSGVIMWVGGGAPVKNVVPSKYVPYNTSIKNETKVDMLIDWLTDKNPINLGMMYFDQPDGFGHTYGPNSPQVTGMIAGLDGVVGYLLTRLQEKGLLGSVNIIITSDHGFTETPEEKLINLNDFIDADSYRFYIGTPIANIWPEEGREDEIYQNLTAAAQTHGHFSVFKREDIPTHFHYSNNRRISPIVAVADDTFSFCTGDCVPREKGDHGYDNRLQDMHPFFLAMGPSFKKNVSVDTFDNVDVYPLMCFLLGAQPAPNNGSLSTVFELLVNTAENYMIVTITFVITAIFVSCVGGVFAAGVLRKPGDIQHRQFGEYSSIVYDHQNAAASVEENDNRPGTTSSSSLGHSSKFTESKVPLLLAPENDDF